jgi:hypothetical protein
VDTGVFKDPGSHLLHSNSHDIEAPVRFSEPIPYLRVMPVNVFLPQHADAAYEFITVKNAR